MPELELIVGFAAMIQKTDEFAHSMTSEALKQMEKIEKELEASGDFSIYQLDAIPEYQKWKRILQQYQPEVYGDSQPEFKQGK